jgi:hypothetical protein
MYQITQLKGKNSPLSHAKRQRWPRRRAPQAASEPTASQTAADRPSVQMPSALTPQHYRARAGDEWDRFRDKEWAEEVARQARPHD